MRSEQLPDPDQAALRSPLHDADVDLESRVQRLLAEYLRAWGLRDPQAIALRCQCWTSRFTAAGNVSGEASTAGILYTALEQASREMEAWVDQLAQAVGGDSNDVAARRGLLAMQLQTVIDRYPSALLEEAAVPERMLDQLRDVARPAVPVSCPTSMLPQPLDSLAVFLRWEWWTQPLRRWWGMVPRPSSLE